MVEYTKFHIDRQVIKGNLVSHVELLNVRTLDKQPEVVESDLPGGYSGSFRKTRNMLKTYEEHSIFRKNRSAVQQYVVFFSLFPQYPLQRKLQRIKNIYLIANSENKCLYNAIFGLFKNKTIVTSLVEVLQPDTKSKQTTAFGQSSITSDPFETFCMRPCAEMTALKM